MFSAEAVLVPKMCFFLHHLLRISFVLIWVSSSEVNNFQSHNNLWSHIMINLFDNVTIYDHVIEKSATYSVMTITRKMKNMARARVEELVLFRKRTNEKENVTESKQENMSKKKSNICGHNKKNEGGKELLKVIREETEKLSIKENKEKSGTHSKVCYCAPTTHEGSFRCRLHRKKPATDAKSNPRMNSQCTTKVMVEFQPHFSMLGRVPSVQVGTHGSLLKLSRMDSV